MKINLLSKSVGMLLLSIFLLSFASPDESDLYKLWEETKPSELEKRFDLEYDKFRNSSLRYSHTFKITPTELKKFIERLQKAIQEDDVEELASMMRYPLKVAIPGHTLTPEGYREGNSFLITNESEFIQIYHSKIYSPQLEKVIQCLTLDNIDIRPSQGINAALGQIWFTVDYESRRISIFILSANRKFLELWLERMHCSAQVSNVSGKGGGE